MDFDSEFGPAGAPNPGVRERVSPEEGLALLLDDAESQHIEATQRAVGRASRITDAIELAAANPWIYAGVARDAVAIAERAAVFEIAARLHLPEPQVRGMVSVVRIARADLPALWAVACKGFAAFAYVEGAVAAIVALRPAPGADQATTAASADAIATFDAKVAEVASALSLTAFRARVRRLVEQLAALLGVDAASWRHATAMTERRVIVEPSVDGMSWVGALVPTVKAVAFMRRLTATAKHLPKVERHGRTRDQIRADLLCEWLTGEGTATAVKVKVFVTVPLDVLAGERAPGRPIAGISGGSSGARGEQAELVGHGPIDPATARQLFFDATAFHRVATDPVSGVKLDMDRRTYRPTAAQRDWLILTHGTCARDGCNRLALDADLDHQIEWARGGKTNQVNLAPLCPADHVARHRSRLRFRRRENGSVEVTSPTGFRSSESPPF